MYLVLILPDGSKSMIPVEWTDFAIATHSKQATAAQTMPTLGSLADLLHARAVVDALLSRLAAVNSENSKAAASKESTIAKEPESLRSSSPRSISLGNRAPRTQDRRYRDPGTHHREHNARKP
jgi:hypothetical protein